jgi:hypothetical protein
LERAGATGVKVAPLAEALGTKSANIYAWFHSAAKRYKGIINKIGSAHYRLDGRLPEKAPAARAAAPKASKTAKAPKAPKAPKAKAPKTKKGGTPRGYLLDGVVATLAAAGPEGASIKEIAAKLGVGYKNIAVWFATTGRKNPSIKKIAPARYQLAR